MISDCCNNNYNYKPSWTATTSTTEPVGTTGNGFTINDGTSKFIIDNEEISTSKFMIDNEEIDGDDLRFLHEFKDNFKYLGVTAKDCTAAIAQMIQQVDNNSNYTYADKMCINNPIEGEKMNIMKNVHFGCCGDRAKISHLGIAVKNLNGSWVSYDKANNEIVDVDLISFGDGSYVYMIPVALKDVAVGDAVVHNGDVVFVKAVKNDGLRVIDVTVGEEKKIVPTKSLFGFDFVTKVVSLIDFSSMSANEDNPFGNMLPFLLLSNTNEKDSCCKKDNNILPLAFMMMNGNNGLNLIQKDSQSMMLMAMLFSNLNQTKSSLSEILPLMMLMQQNGGKQEKE